MLEVALPWCGALTIARLPGASRDNPARSPPWSWLCDDRKKPRREPRQHGALAFGFDVARQHERHISNTYLEDDGVVVAHALPLPLGCRRVQHPDLHDAMRFGILRPNPPQCGV